MKKLYALMAVFALFAGAGLVLADAEWSGTGEIVEMGCFKGQGAKGEGHAGCAKKCLSDGKEMGLLQDDGSVVKLQKGSDETPYKELIDLAGKQAKVMGTEADGVVTVTGAAAG